MFSKIQDLKIRLVCDYQFQSFKIYPTNRWNCSLKITDNILKYGLTRRIGLWQIFGITIGSRLDPYSVFPRSAKIEFRSSGVYTFISILTGEQEKNYRNIWFACSTRYNDGPYGPSCTLMPLCCVLKKNFQNFIREFSDEVAECTKKLQKKQKPDNAISIL